MVGPLAGHIAAVTGGGSGIGQGICQAYARDGARVIGAESFAQLRECPEVAARALEPLLLARFPGTGEVIPASRAEINREPEQCRRCRRHRTNSFSAVAGGAGQDVRPTT